MDPKDKLTPDMRILFSMYSKDMLRVTRGIPGKTRGMDLKSKMSANSDRIESTVFKGWARKLGSKDGGICCRLRYSALQRVNKYRHVALFFGNPALCACGFSFSPSLCLPPAPARNRSDLQDTQYLTRHRRCISTFIQGSFVKLDPATTVSLPHGQ